MSSVRQWLRKLSTTNWKWLFVALAGVPAIRLYCFQEIIAALIISMVLSVAIFSVVLIILFLNLTSKQILVWAEAGVARVVRWVVGGAENITVTPALSQVASHPFRRERRENRRAKARPI